MFVHWNCHNTYSIEMLIKSKTGVISAWQNPADEVIMFSGEKQACIDLNNDYFNRIALDISPPLLHSVL